MNDILEDTQSRPYLSSTELRTVEIPGVRKGGLDADICREVLERAALTVDSLTEANERLNAERRNQIEQYDDQLTELAELRARAADPARQSEPERASRLLAAAQATADALIADATLEITTIRDSADGERDALRRRNEDLRRDLDAELVGLKASVEVERLRVTALFAKWAEDVSARRALINDTLDQIRQEIDVIHETTTIEPADELDEEFTDARLTEASPTLETPAWAPPTPDA